MKSAIDYQPSLGFGVLLMGPPKTGKTTLACRFPNPWIGDCDNNLAPALRWLNAHDPAQTKQVRYDTIDMNDDGSMRPEELRWAELVKCANIAVKDPTIETLVGGDTLTSLSQYLMDHIVASKPSGRKEGMTISDWIPFRELLGKYVKGLRATRKLVIFTAHDEANKDDITGALNVTPSMPSKMAGTIGGLFSDVWHLESEVLANEVKYKVRCAPRPNIQCLGNSLGLPMEFQFTWADFSKLLYSSGMYKQPTKK